MNVFEEHSRSLWMDVECAPEARPLRGSKTADICIIGSGIAGLSTAYELSQRGLSVIVLDRGRIGMGMTARTTAHLAPPCDDSFDSLVSVRGVENARMFNESHAAAVSRIEAIQDGHWQTRQMPTATQRRDLEIATAGLDALERDLKALIAGDLAKLEEAFAAAGAPWTPGRRVP